MQNTISIYIHIVVLQNITCITIDTLHTLHSLHSLHSLHTLHTLHCVHYIVLHDITLHYIALHCIAYMTLHYIALRYITWHYNTQHSVPKYYILYPSISIYTPCKLLKYPPYTPYNLDIKHLQMHKDYPCRTCRIVVVGNPPRPQGGRGEPSGWGE